MGTQTQQTWIWIGNHLWQIILFGSLFIQIAPIKINPWSALLKWIGKLITGDACTKIDGLIEKVNKIDGLVQSVNNLKTDINNINQDVMTNEKDRIRWEILDFANSCHNGRRHTRDEYRHIDKLNHKYIQLLEQTNDSNGEFEAEYDYIKELYAERIRKNDFLENREGISND